MKRTQRPKSPGPNWPHHVRQDELTTARPWISGKSRREIRAADGRPEGNRTERDYSTQLLKIQPRNRCREISLRHHRQLSRRCLPALLQRRQCGFVTHQWPDRTQTANHSCPASRFLSDGRKINSNSLLSPVVHVAEMVLFGAVDAKVTEHVRVDLVYGMVSDRGAQVNRPSWRRAFLMRCASLIVLHLAVVRGRLDIRRSVDDAAASCVDGVARADGRFSVSSRLKAFPKSSNASRRSHRYRREPRYEKPLQ